MKNSVQRIPSLSLRVIVICVLFSSLAASEEVSPTRSLTWLTSMEDALRKAGQEGKPVFVDFWAIWCGYCKDLELAFETPEFSEVLSEYVLARIDFDVEKEWVSRYGIRTLPTTLVLGETGEVIMRSVGRTPTRILLRRTQTAVSGYQKYRDELPNKEDIEVLLRRADYLLYSGNPFASLENLKLVLERMDRNDAELKEQVFFTVGLCLIAARDFSSAREIFVPLAREATSPGIRSDSLQALDRIAEIERQKPSPSLPPPH